MKSPANASVTASDFVTSRLSINWHSQDHIDLLPAAVYICDASWLSPPTIGAPPSYGAANQGSVTPVVAGALVAFGFAGVSLPNIF